MVCLACHAHEREGGGGAVALFESSSSRGYALSVVVDCRLPIGEGRDSLVRKPSEFP